MAFVITLPDAIEEQVQAAASARGQSVNEFAIAALLEMSVRNENEDAEDIQEALEGIRRGMAAAAKGDEIPFEDYVAAVTARQGQTKNQPSAEQRPTT